MKSFACILFFITFYVQASDGKVIFSKGEVLINGKASTKGTEFSYKDKIVVKDKGLAVIHINPATKIKLKAGAELIIEKPLRTKSTSSFTYILNQGEIFIKAKRTKQNRYNVKTKFATMGVRGTEFFVSTSKSQKSRDWMCVREGQVEVSVKNATGTVLVNKGEGVAISEGVLPNKQRYKWTTKLNWKFDGDSGLEDTTDIQNINYNLEDKEYD